MDWEQLLKHYMAHVADEEGTSFVSSLRFSHGAHKFTNVEVAVLEALDEQRIRERLAERK